jgi:signal transduction histidine kinase
LRLQVKVIVLTMVVLIVIGIVSGGTMLYFQRRDSVRQFEHVAGALAGAVQGSLEQGMLSGESQPVQDAIVRISEEQMVSGVALLTPEGKITASSDVAQIGGRSNRQEVALTLTSGRVSTWANRDGNRGQFNVVSSVLNKTECQSCHSPDATVLGAIQVTLDTSMLDDQMKQQTIFFGVFGGLALVVIGVSLTFALRKIALNPISRLAESAQKLSRGDYAARIGSYSDDEIGMLARTFNEMAQSVEKHSYDLEASRQELANWNADLERKIEQRTAQLAASNAIVTTVSQSLDLNWILEAALSRVISVTALDGGAVHFLDRKSDHLEMVAHEGLSRESMEKMHGLGTNGDILRKVVQSRFSLKISEGMGIFKTAGMQGEEGEFHDCIVLPIKSENRVQATLALASYRAGKFEAELVRLLQSMCDAIGIAVTNATTAQKLKESNKIRAQLLEKLISAQEDERRRIARELHDEASQSLAALVLHLEDAMGSLPARNSATRQKLEVLKERAVHTLGNLRFLALELRPSALDELGLAKAIEWYAKDYLGKRGLDARVEISGPRVKLSSQRETMLFRVIQEALTNVVKHAEASQVCVKLQLNASSVRVQIDDNGKGFDVNNALRGESQARNLGLHGMTERVILLGGTLNILSEPGRGTHLSIESPLEGASPN